MRNPTERCAVFRYVIPVLVMVMALSGQFVWAADHYVSPAGTASWEKSTDIQFPCSLDTANANVRAGDTVYLRAGDYTSFIAPASSGVSDGERIRYQAYRGEKPVIRGTRYAILIEGKSSITVEGIAFHNCRQFLIMTGGHYNDIRRCTFDTNKTEEEWMGSWVHENSTFNRIYDCVFSRYGWVKDGDDKGCLLDIGYDTSTTDATDCNVVENNVFFYGGHHILHICGTNNVVRGNYLHNENWMKNDSGSLNGNRCAMTIGAMARRNLFENNRFAFSGKPPDDNGADGLVLRSPDNIVRRNMCYANGAAGIAFASMKESTPTGNYVYFNTLYHNGYCEAIDYYWTGGLSFGNWGNGPMPGNTIINNIFSSNKDGKSVTGYGERGPQRIENNFMDEGDPGFVDTALPSDTANAKLPDFRLVKGSPCIDKGVFLTKVASETGSGTTFMVVDAGYFYDGWGIPGETGDLIQLAGSNDTARIVKVDYVKNILTVDRSLTWTKGQSVSLPYTGAAPDLGAVESP